MKTHVVAGAVRNIYRVPKAQWRKWDRQARATFNYLNSLMLKSPDLFKHPKHAIPPLEARRTMAWNAAWIAADCVRDALKGKAV